MKSLLGILCVLWVPPVLAQQACPVNSNFNLSDLTHWFAYTGNNQAGNGPSAIKMTYDSTLAAPLGTIGATQIKEYNLPSVNGIHIITSSTSDYFGGFPTIPTINGYAYYYSVCLGSTSISRGNGTGGNVGGYIRGISYRINVPASATPQPYTMTYAYAMVLENGTHNSDEQPLFSATLSTADSVITCASPKYFLPTNNDAANGGTGAVLDTAVAVGEGFQVSKQPSVNSNPNSSNGEHLYDVWWKGWREVTFDLSPYRGQQVVLTFEADNCVPGGHFAYAYVALRNTCAGLLISGDTVACTNTNLMYSIPSLAGANYSWSIPSDWTIVSGLNSNIISVNAGVKNGQIIASEVNSCANLHDTINVRTAPPTIAGKLIGTNTVCANNNSNLMNLVGARGSVINWLYSTNGGGNWLPFSDTSAAYTAINLNTTTTFAAVLQNGQSCAVDTSGPVTINVDPQSVGGTLGPPLTEVCTGQNKGAFLTLNGATGQATNWQSSLDNVTWNDLVPTDTTHSYGINNITGNTAYRVIVKSGVCPADTSSLANVTLLPEQFPVAAIDPADTLICYGDSAPLNAVISVGTSYSWATPGPLQGTRSGQLGVTPYDLGALATPLASTPYVLTIFNTGCPNPLVDTFQVNVYPPIIASAGHDTAVVVGQPLQLNATSNDPGDVFAWSPGTDLNNVNIANPIAVLGGEIDTIRYTVTATAPSSGCKATASITVKVFTTPPDIFVPSAFTPAENIDNLFKPILVGISSLQFFKVYNRYGQLVYSTSSTESGWDGTVNGHPQASQAYVWMVQGTTYQGKTIFKKGTVVLMR